MSHTPSEADALNGLLQAIERLVDTAKTLGAEPQVTALLRRLSGTQAEDQLELSLVLTTLREFEKRRKHNRAELDMIDNAKAVVKRRMRV